MLEFFRFCVWLSTIYLITLKKPRISLIAITCTNQISCSTLLILKSTSIPMASIDVLAYISIHILHTTRILQCTWPMTFFYNLTFAHRPIGFCSSMRQRWNFIGPSLLRHHCDAINVRSNTTSLDQCALFSCTVGFMWAKISAIISTHQFIQNSGSW